MTEQRQVLTDAFVGGDLIQAGTFIQSPAAPNPLSKPDFFPPPTALFGRVEEIAKLRIWLGEGNPPVLQIIGQCGAGKTALAANVVHGLKLEPVRLQLHKDEKAIGLVGRLFEVITNRSVPTKSCAEIVAMAIDEWHRRHCLLVIDNLHHLLDEYGNAKDDEARLLLQRLGESGCQLLTLGWPKTDELGTSRERVEIWELEGLEADPGVQKLRAEGVKGTPSSISLQEVVRRLNGNPKMLENLAALIRDSGDDATILDKRSDWVEYSMAPMHAMWVVLGEPLQELLAAVCIFATGRNAEWLAKFLNRNRKDVQQQLDTLANRWKLIKAVDGVHDYEPDHDLVRVLVKENYGEERVYEMHGRATRLLLGEWEELHG